MIKGILEDFFPPFSEVQKRLPSTPVRIAWCVLIGVVGFAYFSHMVPIVKIWYKEAEYGHCFFVPVFALALLWLRIDMLDLRQCRASWWCLPFLLMWLGLWLVSSLMSYKKPIPFSVIPLMAGVTLLAGGWHAMRWAWPSIVFSIFMIPIPSRFTDLLSGRLQQLATKASVFLIETLGIPVMASGNVIRLPEGNLEVVQACSGLKMMMVFGALSVGAALALKVPLWKKIVILIAAPFIAVFANVMRITSTGVCYELVRRWPSLISSTETIDGFMHDWAGWLMMPLGLLMLWGLMAILNRIFIEDHTGQPVAPMGGSVLMPQGIAPPAPQKKDDA